MAKYVKQQQQSVLIYNTQKLLFISTKQNLFLTANLCSCGMKRKSMTVISIVVKDNQQSGLLTFFCMDYNVNMKEPELLIKIGVNIRALRTKKNMTQNDLAIECEFEKASMSRIESGKSNPTVKTLFKICRVLDVPIAELFKD